MLFNVPISAITKQKNQPMTIISFLNDFLKIYHTSKNVSGFLNYKLKLTFFHVRLLITYFRAKTGHSSTLIHIESQTGYYLIVKSNNKSLCNVTNN